MTQSCGGRRLSTVTTSASSRPASELWSRQLAHQSAHQPARQPSVAPARAPPPWRPHAPPRLSRQPLPPVRGPPGLHGGPPVRSRGRRARSRSSHRHVARHSRTGDAGRIVPEAVPSDAESCRPWRGLTRCRLPPPHHPPPRVHPPHRLPLTAHHTRAYIWAQARSPSNRPQTLRGRRLATRRGTCPGTCQAMRQETCAKMCQGACRGAYQET